MRVKAVKNVVCVLVLGVLISVGMGILGNVTATPRTLLDEHEMRSTLGQGCYGLDPKDCGEADSYNLNCSKTLGCPNLTLNTGDSWNNLADGNYGTTYGFDRYAYCTMNITYTGLDGSNYSVCRNSCTSTENEDDYCMGCLGANVTYSNGHPDYWVR